MASLDRQLSDKRITKALIRLCGCAGWSAPLLFENHRRQVVSRRGPFITAADATVSVFKLFFNHFYLLGLSKKEKIWINLLLTNQSGPEVIKLLHTQLNWAWNFNCSLKLKYRQIKKFLALSLPGAVFIMLINVKMPTIVGILTFMSRINFVLSWVEYEKVL